MRKKKKKKAPKIGQASKKPFTFTLNGKIILESVLKATRDTHARYQA